jgi:regulator of protease activity HflC (stomatin/prohibitin superfamily)
MGVFDAVGQIILDFVRWVVSVIFPFHIINDYEQGVRLRSGRLHALLTSTNGIFGTGLHVYWPLIGEILKQGVVLRVNETPIQTLTTADGSEATLSLGVRWSIHDVRALWLRVHDGEETVLDLVQGTAGAVVPTLTYDALHTDLAPAMVAGIKKRTRGWGIDINEVYLTNLCKPPALRLLTDTHANIHKLLAQQ